MAEENKDIKNLSHFFNDYAAGFSSIYEEDENPRSGFDKFIDKIFRRSMNLRFDLTLERTQKPEINTVLDIGCGPGHFVLQMLKQGKSITALDVAENMLNITKERVKKSELDQEKVNYILSDYMEHEFENKHDAAVVMGFFDYVADPTAVLKKLIRDINKEIYISVPNNKGVIALFRRLRYWWNNCPLYLYSRESLEGYLNAAGCLENTEIIEGSRGFFVIIRN